MIGSASKRPSQTDARLIIPFLKWAGGKRWFTDRYLHIVPEKFERYVEPFLGSGAMYFALAPSHALLSDLNIDLINCYEAILTNPAAIEDVLLYHHTRHSKSYYYATRSSKPTDMFQKAGWFIYMNRTCWNGLYRVNRQNEFNVPLGTKTNVVLSTDNFRAVSRILSRAEIRHQDFEYTLDAAGEGDFVFVDPPYTVKHNQNGFLKYNDKMFSWSDQIRLRNAVERASNRGAMVLVTNANHHSIREIYDGLGHQQVISRASLLSANAAHRSRTEELIIRSWKI